MSDKQEWLSYYSPSISLLKKSWICLLSSVKPLSKIIHYSLTLFLIFLQLIPLLKIDQAPFICLQWTPTLKITHILCDIKHMLLDVNILLHTHIILLCNRRDMRCLCTKFLGITRLSYHFQSFLIKCLCTKASSTVSITNMSCAQC